MIGQARLTDLAIFSPALSLIRGTDGVIYFAGRPLNKKTDEPDDGRFLDWLIDQPGIELHRASLIWRDDLTRANELRFTDVGLQIEKRFGAHEIAFAATPPLPLAKKLEARGKLSIAKDDGQLMMDGLLYAQVDNANLIELRRHLNVPDNWQAGVGTVRAWVELDNRDSKRGAAATVSSATQFANPIKISNGRCAYS